MSSKGKRVHFLDPVTNVVSALQPLTPPSTPPASHSLRLLQPSSDVPSSSTTPSLTDISIHKVLAYGNRLRFNAALPLQSRRAWPRDLSMVAPTGACHIIPSFRNEFNFLVEPATSPPLRSLTLTSDPLLPWQIEVLSSLPNGAVTVYDVLHTLNASLRVPVSTMEMSLLVAEQTYVSIIDAFEVRVNAILDDYEREKQRAKSVRRIDCLMGRTRLSGLRWVGVEDYCTVCWGWP